MDSSLLLRKPVEADIESMFFIMEKSLSPYLIVNKSSSKNSQLIIKRSVVKAYVNEGIYLCLVAKINSEIAGWMAGSSKSEVLSEHGCSPGEFYIEEIVVDYHYRSRGVGSFLLSGIPMERLKAIVVDTPLINKRAIAFYEKNGKKATILMIFLLLLIFILPMLKNRFRKKDRNNITKDNSSVE